jgi:predicted transcriptional regulator
LSQVELTKRAGVSRKYIQQVESGKYRARYELYRNIY